MVFYYLILIQIENEFYPKLICRIHLFILYMNHFINSENYLNFNSSLNAYENQ